MTKQRHATTSWMAVFTLMLVASFLTHHEAAAWTAPEISRRSLFTQTASSLVAAASCNVPAAFALDASILDDLKASKIKLEPIPELLEQKEWDKVRTILKVPPVNKFWNLGDSQNPVMKLARDTGNVELFEMKDDLAYNLQMCDQLTYNNAFVYFQPGSGKLNIKEPQSLARRAMAQFQDIIDIANEKTD